MRRSASGLLFGAIVLSLSAVPAAASADILEFDLDAQLSYVDVAGVPLERSDRTATMNGAAIGARARLQVLFLTGIVDFHHLFDGGDMLHVGAGIGPSVRLGPFRLYGNGTLGMLMVAPGDEFAPVNGTTPDPVVGFQARGGLGLEALLAGEWIAIGAGGDVGVHRLDGEWDRSWLVRGYVGLRL